MLFSTLKRVFSPPERVCGINITLISEPQRVIIVFLEKLVVSILTYWERSWINAILLESLEPICEPFRKVNGIYVLLSSCWSILLPHACFSLPCFSSHFIVEFNLTLLYGIMSKITVYLKSFLNQSNIQIHWT